MTPHPPSVRARAFSLVELLVVMAIIAIIAAFTIPAASTILRGSKLTQASQVVTDQISLARQLALTKNRAIEVRMYRFGDREIPGEEADKPDSGHFRAIQIFEVLESGAVVPLDKPQMLPISVIINPGSLSSLVEKQLPAANPDNTAPRLPRGIEDKYKYVSFRFLQDGSTNLKPSEKWFLTLHNMNEQVTGNTPPPNFFTLQLDPISGSTKIYRPTAG